MGEIECQGSRITRFPLLGPLRETDINSLPTKGSDAQNSMITHLPVLCGIHEPEFNAMPSKKG